MKGGSLNCVISKGGAGCFRYMWRFVRKTFSWLGREIFETIMGSGTVPMIKRREAVDSSGLSGLEDGELGREIPSPQ